MILITNNSNNINKNNNNVSTFLFFMQTCLPRSDCTGRGRRAVTTSPESHNAYSSTKQLKLNYGFLKNYYYYCYYYYYHHYYYHHYNYCYNYYYYYCYNYI